MPAPKASLPWPGTAGAGAVTDHARPDADTQGPHGGARVPGFSGGRGGSAHPAQCERPQAHAASAASPGQGPAQAGGADVTTQLHFRGNCRGLHVRPPAAWPPCAHPLGAWHGQSWSEPTRRHVVTPHHASDSTRALGGRSRVPPEVPGSLATGAQGALLRPPATPPDTPSDPALDAAALRPRTASTRASPAPSLRHGREPGRQGCSHVPGVRQPTVPVPRLCPALCSSHTSGIQTVGLHDGPAGTWAGPSPRHAVRPSGLHTEVLAVCRVSPVCSTWPRHPGTPAQQVPYWETVLRCDSCMTHTAEVCPAG